MSTFADRNSPMVVRETARARSDSKRRRSRSPDTCGVCEGSGCEKCLPVEGDPTRGADANPRRMTLRLPDDAWEALDALAPKGERVYLIAYLLRCERKRQAGGAP